MRLPILSNMLNLGITNPLGAFSLRITSRNGVEVILCITYKVKGSTMYVIKEDLSTIAWWVLTRSSMELGSVMLT